MKQALIEYIQKNCIQYGNFVLSSGKQSNFYLDIKKLLLDPDYYELLVEMFHYEFKKLGFTALGGMETASIPISILLTNFIKRKYFSTIKPFYIRKEERSHGLLNSIVGELKPNSKIILVEDVVTTGKSIITCNDILNEQKHEVIKVISIVDRDEGGRQILKENNFNYSYLVGIEELIKN